MLFRLKKSICFIVFISVFFYKQNSVLLAYTAAFVHECAHWLAARVFGVKPTEFCLGILGARLTLPCKIKSKNKIFIYLSGPLVSFCVWGCICVVQKLIFSKLVYLSFFGFANFAIGVINIMPVFPLDGGIVLKSVLSMKTGVIKGTKKSKKVSLFLLTVLGVLLVVLYGLKVFNPCFTVVFLFLVFSQSKEESISLQEKRMVLSGNMPTGSRLKYLACDAESELLCLAECISCDYTLVVAAFYKERFLCDLNQNDIIYGIKKYGALCTVKDYNIKEKQKNICSN